MDYPDARSGLILWRVKAYGQFCPIAQALEILAERWTLLIVRELLCDSHRFSEIQRGVPLMSRTLLSQRLKSLQEAGIIRRREHSTGPWYELTEAGEALRDIVTGIGIWGKRYADRSLSEDQLDPKLLMWDVQRRLDRSALPRLRTVVLFRFADAKVGERRFWLHADKSNVELCLTASGFDVDLTVDTDVRTLTEVWMGQRSLPAAIRNGSVRLEGPPALKRAFPGWLQLSQFASAG